MAFSIRSTLLVFIVALCKITYVWTIECYSTYQVSSGTIQISSATAVITPENETCSVVGCVCYSFQTTCSSSSSIAATYTPCSQQDQQNGVTKWKWGQTSKTKCEQLQRQSQIYLNMICCDTNLCNKQYDPPTTTSEPNRTSSDSHPKWSTLIIMHLLLLAHIFLQDK
ncbi:unnamed protein product [Rotaria sordida]|uniref:Activin types I and II receptor domain-containing protein n=1 Tax=Rotaria sordida TaxID=392033 RepID=A0A819GDI2_9BILA|nr:unnamed protein product [Rotaria sordida]CAF3881154.1 unnamed protein product [Rotaria sordida]